MRGILVMSGEGKAVCVTGASGFTASWLIKFLLQRGYIVKGTVRDPNDSKKTEHLHSLDGAKERLHLVKADLLDEGSFDTAVHGCEGVFHTASPVFRPTNEPPVQLIEAAVRGTLNVLKSCAKVPSVKRVIITSSMMAATVNENPLTSDVAVDESWYSDVSVCESKKMWYAASKTLAEEAAWKFQKENGIDMVVLNPGFVIGPFLQPTLNLTTEVFFNHATGAEKFPVRNYTLVDVRDVANAHIQAFELPSANGRYCLIGGTLHFSEILQILHDHYPTLHLRVLEISQDEKAFPPKYETSKEKVKTLGVEFTPVKVSVIDTFESLKEKGFLNIWMEDSC